MKKLRCYLFGHTQTDLNDSGYHACERCKSHEYYNFPQHWDKSGVLLKPYHWLIRRLYQLKYDIQHCYRRYIKGDDLPF